VDGGDDGYLARVHGSEKPHSTAVGPQKDIVTGRALHLLMSTPAQNPRPSAARITTRFALAGFGHGLGEVEPALRRAGR
jgi:hypothetical protein